MRKCVRCNTEMNEELEIKVDMQSYGISVKKGTEYICSAGTKNIFIDINGDVYPCNLFANNKWEYPFDVLL